MYYPSADVDDTEPERQGVQELLEENLALREALKQAQRYLAAALLKSGCLDTKRHRGVVAIDVALGRTA